MNQPSQQFSGWRVSIALAILASSGMAFSNAFGVVFETVSKDLDIDIALIGLGMSIMMLAIGLTAPIMGRLADKGPIRPHMLAGVAGMLLGIWIITTTSNGWILALGMLLCSVGIAFHGMVPSNAIANNWFEKKRAAALSIIAIGLSIGGLWIPPVTAWLMQNGSVENDWRYGLQMMAMGLAAISAVVILFGVVRRPEDLGQLPDGEVVPVGDEQTEHDSEALAEVDQQSFHQAKGSRDLWFIALAFAIITMVSMCNGAFIVPFLEERGSSKLDASFALSVIALSSMLGSLSAGLVADRIGPKKVLLTTLSLQLVAFIVLLLLPVYSVSLFASAVVGLGVGSFMPMQPMTAGARFGRGIAGRVIGIFGITALPFTLSGIPLGALAAGVAGSYAAVYIGAVIFLVIALALISVSSLSVDH